MTDKKILHQLEETAKKLKAASHKKELRKMDKAREERRRKRQEFKEREKEVQQNIQDEKRANKAALRQAYLGLAGMKDELNGLFVALQYNNQVDVEAEPLYESSEIEKVWKQFAAYLGIIYEVEPSRIRAARILKVFLPLLKEGLTFGLGNELIITDKIFKGYETFVAETERQAEEKTKRDQLQKDLGIEAPDPEGLELAEQMFPGLGNPFDDKNDD